VRESEGLATSGAEREQRSAKCHGEKHVHLTNCIHIRRHLHLQSRGGSEGLMLDARRTTPRLPLLREVTALQKIRTLQDPGTSSGSATASSTGSSSAGRSKNVPTFIGDPHRDAQALAIELSGKLAKSAAASYASDGASSRTSRPPRTRAEKGVRVDNPKQSRKKMTAEQRGSGGGLVEVPSKVDVRDRIKRIEQAFQDGSTTNTLSGELRKEGLIKELKERGRIQRDREIAEQSSTVGAEIPRSDERWEDGPARREEIARRVIEERGSSISSLSQLLGNHYGSGRSAQLNLLDEGAERRSSHHGESLFETDEDELSPMEREMTRPRSAILNPASPLHLASLSRGKEELKRPRNPRAQKSKPGSKGTRERNVKPTARPRSRNSTGVNQGGAIIPPASAIADDELDVSELPPQNGCGIPWDWSQIHKYGGKAFLDVTGLACAIPESTRRDGLEAVMMDDEQTLPVQSISSLDSDANALPLILGEDAHDSDFAGYIDTGRSREVPQKLASKRKSSLQNAVKDVPVVEPASTSGAKEPATPLPEGARTLTQKYRPKNFREIVGQSVVVKSLSTAIMKGKVAPVYLFIGSRGTGKTSAARVFAAGLNCESLDYARRPCGICRECGTMALNRSADVRELDAASNADLASMRAAMGSFTPAGRYKVFIVEGCDSLSADIWNAFLKVLEEPPTNVVFILITTDAEQIPATATSRCQKFHFSKVKEADIVTRLEALARKEGLAVEDGALALIAARSDGSLRDAEIVLDQVCLLDKTVSVALVRELVGLLPDAEILDLLDYALSADTINTVRTLREVLASGVEPLSLVSQLGTLIADILAGSYDVRREARGEGFFNRNFCKSVCA
jgi:DNA polymerase III subunit gamma/tau